MKSCLIVDDSKVIRMVARRILEALAFEIVEAVNGKEALEFCNARLPDVILLDWNMPVMSGIEFLHALRNEVGGGDRPVVVFCTTENDMAHISEAISGGANEYIMKPFDKDIIEAKFAEVGLI